MSIIWTLKLFTKGFCSRTEAFVKQTLKKLSTEYKDQIKSKIGTRYNISNAVLGLFSDDPNPNEKYLSALKNAVPAVFKEFFGKYNQLRGNNLELSPNPMLDFNEEFDSSNYYTPDRYYGPDITTSEIITTTPFSSTMSYGLRDRFKNKTITKAKSFLEYLSEKNETTDMYVSILENLPLYLTLSFLLARYLILFIGCSADALSKSCKVKPESDKDKSHSEMLNKAISQSQGKEIVDGLDALIKSLDYQSQNRFTSEMKHLKNHNYYYIRNLLSNLKLIESESSLKNQIVTRTILRF
jgi:hypothetical protein